MADVKGTTLEDRRKNAAEARKAQLARFLERPAADDPAVVARAEERRKINEARKIRDAEREERRKREAAEKAVRDAAEAAAREAARIAAEEAAESERVRIIEEKIALEASKKAERDARYAARKERKAQRKTELRRY